MKIHIWSSKTRSIKTRITSSKQEAKIFHILEIENERRVQYKPLECVTSNVNLNVDIFPMEIQNREDIDFDARTNSKSNKPLRQEKNTRMNKHEIENENEIRKVSTKRARTYPTRKSENKTMLIKQKEHKYSQQMQKNNLKSR